MKKIILFTASACPLCASARSYLKSCNMRFTEKNIREDKDALNELIEKRILGIPIIIIDDEVIVGFNKDRIERILKN